jgi:peptidoglycan/LPS O-acetylase OafA/YrhL
MLSHPKYRPDIDGLRAVAVLLVLGFHIFPETIVSGFIGVDIFFVISGYLISNIIIKNLDAGSFSFSQFYARRIRRIFPALIFVLVCSSFFALISLYPSDLFLFKKYLLGGVLFVSNFTSWAESGYFDVASYSKPLLHLWSLGIEEQFYVVWPLFLVVAYKYNVRHPLVISALLIASFSMSIFTVYGDGVAAFYSPACRFWEFMVGGFLASIESRKKPGAGIGYSLELSLAGAVLLILAIWLIRSDYVFPGWWALMPTAAAVFIIASGSDSFINRKILAHPWLVWIGLISYPLYLWHWPVISFFWIIHGEMPGIVDGLVIVLVSLIMAWLTYRCIEQPVGRDVNFSAPLVPALLIVMVSIGLFGGSFYLNKADHVEERVSKEQLPTPWKKVLLMGDSHGDHLFSGLNQEIGGVTNKTYSGCLPFRNLDTYSNIYRRGGCLLKVGEVYKAIEDGQTFEVVVMSSMGPVYLTGEAFKGMGVERTLGLNLLSTSQPDVSDRAQIYESAMRESFQFLLSLNKTVVFAIDVPELGLDPRYCEQNYSKGDEGAKPLIERSHLSDCTILRSEFDARTKAYRDLVFKVLADFPQVKVFDPTGLFCDKKKCRGVHDGKVLYKDSDHLSAAGSEYVAKYLAPIIREQLH